MFLPNLAPSTNAKVIINVVGRVVGIIAEDFCTHVVSCDTLTRLRQDKFEVCRALSRPLGYHVHFDIPLLSR